MRRRFALGLVCLALAGCGGNESVGPMSDQGVRTFASWYRRAVISGGHKVPSEYRADNPSSFAAFEMLIRRLCEIDLDAPHSTPPGVTLKDDPAFFGNPGFAAAAIMNALAVCGLLD
jgi:hypothetical protein